MADDKFRPPKMRGGYFVIADEKNGEVKYYSNNYSITITRYEDIEQ